MAERLRLAGTGAWNDTSRWSGGTVPASGDHIVRFEPGEHIITGALTTGIDINKVIKPRDATVRLQGGTLSIDLTAGTDPQLVFDSYGAVDDFRITSATKITKIKAQGPSKLRLVGGACDAIYAGPGADVHVDSAATLVDLLVQGGLITVLTHASDKIRNADIIDGSLATARTIDTLARLGGLARLIMESGATVTDGASGAKLSMLSPQCLVNMRSGGVTIDIVERIAGNWSWDGCTGNVTIASYKEGFGVKPIAERWPAGALTITAKSPYSLAELEA